MYIMHLALGGCLKAPPVLFGVTADTGGHIAYVLEAALAQARLQQVERVSIVTRLFEDARLGTAHDRPHEPLGERIGIDRIATGRREYLEKEALALDLPDFIEAFCAHLASSPRLPDVIHAHFSDAAAAALAARSRFGIPVVYTPHALAIDKRIVQPDCGGLDTRIEAERLAIAQADAIIVSTRDEAERQVRAYGVAGATARTMTLPPGVPRRARPGQETRLAARLLERLRDPRKPIVLAIARPVRKKNLAGLVHAYLATPALIEHANLVILAGQRTGAASAEEAEVVGELERLQDDERLRGCMALPPCHDADDVAALYAKAARGGVFVNAALHEPFGLTLIEAAAAGVPVVATRHGGPSEIVATLGHGLLVDPCDPAAIGAACLEISSDKDLHRRLSKAALRHVGHYDWDRYARLSVSLYAGLCQPRLQSTGRVAAA
ncbi:glycosyltransferase [Lichenicoccus roseus]|uniref:sucrose-phosphate synthase n=1 Tax=Lichenicoccus roseus TaxID=2683649 RepID=A0A5R9J7K4_9PROT|nr:glycosyltransferase [Lichenicoccus roseus]